MTRVSSDDGDPTDDPAQSRAQAQAQAQALLEQRTRLGRYVLVEAIGKGAFGLVWNAYDPELDRKVAIKLLQVRGSERGRDELLAEAQLPAQLSHPNVVAIHDVGWLDAEGSQGRALYVVMEHLGGPTLRAWLDEQPRPWPEVVGVLAQAGRGLEAAHRRQLVHLDFKPGNVMFGDDGRPRVLDFGLARVASGRVESGRSESGSLPIAGTPAYMAPEQHAGAEPDARSDQYAFGVTLWEALWGRWPFASSSSKWLREIYEQKLAGPPAFPRKPSVPAHLRAVVARALAVAPEDRFADMGSLIAALEDDPAARRRRWIYTGLGAAAIAGLGWAAITRDSDPCALADDRLDGVWDEQVAAELDAAFASSGVDIAGDVMTRVRAGLDDQVARWTEVRAQVCEAGRASAKPDTSEGMGGTMSEEFLCLEVHLGRVAALTESLRAADSQTIARAADSVVQLPAPEDCLEIRRGRSERERALDDQTRAALLEVEAELAQAKAELSLGRYEDALETAERGLANAEALGEPEVLARARFTRGHALELLARYDEADPVLLAALREAELTGDERTAIEVMFTLIHALTQAGHNERALLLSELVGARLESPRLDETQLEIKLDLHISQIYFRQQRWDEALAQAEQGLARQLELDPNDKTRIADFELAIGNVHVGSTRDLEAGREHYDRALAIWREIYGPGHPAIGTTLVNLSAISFRSQARARAREQLQSALEIFAYTLPPTHPRFGMIHQNLSALYMVDGRYPEAIEHSKAALEVLEASFGREATQYAIAESNLAATLVLEGRYAEAVEHAQHMLKVYEAELGREDGRRLAALDVTIEALWGLERDAEAEPLLAEVRELMQEVPADDPRQVEALYVLAEAHRRAGQLDEALVLCERVLERLDDGLDEPEPVADVARTLASTLRQLGRPEDARARIIPLLERLGGASTGPPDADADADPHIASWQLYLELGNIERALGNDGAARAHYEAALALRGEAPALRAEIEAALAQL